jgi:hypothetical protein
VGRADGDGRHQLLRLNSQGAVVHPACCRDRLIRRNGRDAVVTYSWQIARRLEQEHHLEIAVAQVEPDGSVRACSERLSIWPFRYEELVAQLRSVGLEVETTTFDPDAEGYLVVAGRSEPSS